MPARPTIAETLTLVWRLWKRYDLAVSTQSGDRPTLFALAAGRTHAGLTGDGRAADRPSAQARRCFIAARRPSPNIHRVEQMLRLADALGIARVPELVCPAAGPVEPIAPGENYAVIHAAPMFRYKQWTREGWRALAAGLTQRGLSVVAISGPDEAERRYLDDVWQGIDRRSSGRLAGHRVAAAAGAGLRRARYLGHPSRRRHRMPAPWRCSDRWTRGSGDPGRSAA